MVMGFRDEPEIGIYAIQGPFHSGSGRLFSLTSFVAWLNFDWLVTYEQPQNSGP
jgi:hypothetical protein